MRKPPRQVLVMFDTEEFRPKLYRRVETGVLSAIDTNRGRVDPAVRPDRR